MDIRSIIDPDASETAGPRPASRQRSDAKKVSYSQPQSNFQSPYEAQASAYKGPRETRPPQPPPLLPPAHPTHNDLRSPSTSSHHSSRSPYQQTPSSALSGGQYPFPQHPAQSLAHGFQPAQYGQRESHVASTPTGYQPYGQPTSISQTPIVTTPVSSHSYSNQTHQGSSRSLSTPTSAQSNTVKESPKASFDPTFDPVKAMYESHSSQQYHSQQGPPFRPPLLTGRTTSASYENQRNHSASSHGHQQMMSSSPTTDRPGSSVVSPLASGPRQSLSHTQSFHNKQEREKSLSVSPKTRLPSGSNLRQSNDDLISTLVSKHVADVSATMNAGKVEISEDWQGVHSSQEQSAIQSPSRSRSLGMKGILNSPSLNEITPIVKEFAPQTKKLPPESFNNHEPRIIPANTIRSDRPESQSWPNFAMDSKQKNHGNSSSGDRPPSRHFSPKWNSSAVSMTSKTQSQPQNQIQTQAEEYSKEQTSSDSIPPHVSPILHTKNLSSVPARVANSSSSQTGAVPQSSFIEPSSTVSFPGQASPAQTTRYSISPAVPNSAQSEVIAKSPLKEQSPKISFSPRPSSLQPVGQPAVSNQSQSQTTLKSSLKEQTPPTSFLSSAAVPQLATHSPSPTFGNLPISHRATTPPLQPQTTMSPAPSSQTVMSSGSTAIAEPVEQQTATKKVQGAVIPAVGSSSDRRRKRRRFEEIPIYARSCRESLPAGSRKTGAISKSRSPVKTVTHPSQPAQPMTTRSLKHEPNGLAVPTNDALLPNPNAMAPGSGLLEHWEDSFTNTIPSDEYIRQLSDFLYKEVVGRLDVDVGPPGGGSAVGAVIEVEAKIGQLIDKNSNTRLRLPVMTECVLNKNDPGLRVNFKSSMTEAQHRAMNGFLNQAFSDSQNAKGRAATPHTKPRIPMSYVHTHESDTFYELSQAGLLSLPQSILHTLNARHSKAKVRVTIDQKTGNTLAKIVKVRLADLDVYSPSTEFDYRVSVNLEKNLEGEWRDLVEPTARNGRKSDRNKDRVSYKHLAYQIDLTQVVSPEAAQKEHELEVEVSTAELRKHGILLRDGQPNEFQKFVEGFVNNIRILTRGPNYEPRV